MSDAPQINPGEIIGWPILKIEYGTDPANIAKLLPPGFTVSDDAKVHLNVYCVPVPDEPEYGVLQTVDADYNGMRGQFAIGLGIDQEAAIFISRETNGQPKYPAEIDYYRFVNTVSARATHQGYTFMEFQGQVGETLPNGDPYEENEWWVKVSRAVGGAEKAYDFPPHAVRVKSTYQTVHQQKVEGELTLRESKWDPIARYLPIESEVSATLWTPQFLGRDITLEAPLDPEGYWPFVDTVSGSHWPGTHGGPLRD